MKRFGIPISFTISAFAAIFLVGYFNSPPRYSELKNSCEITVSKSPNKAALLGWLAEHEIPHRYEPAPYDQHLQSILASHGMNDEIITNSNHCIYFEGLSVRGGILSYRVASGYFLIDAENELLDYTLAATN